MPAMMAATENIAKSADHPFHSFTGPTKSWPKIEPIPAVPSAIPDIVATALRLFLSNSSLPKSKKMIEIKIVAPVSKMLNVVSKNVKYPVCSIVCTVVIRQRQMAPIKHPSVKKGDLRRSRSLSKPIISEPRMPPTDPNDVILAACSFE